jgi:hypothetical protein
MDRDDGQQCAPGGELGCGDPSRRTQIGGVQTQPAPHGL